MKTDQSIDEKLVNAYKAGNKKAMAALVRRWHKLFCDKAYWLVKDKDIAKDIAQDSWTVIINKIENLKEPKQFKYWALKIVCNKSTDWLRAQTKINKHSIRNNLEIENDDQDYSENEQLKLKMLNAIHALPDNQRAVVRLYYLEDYSLKEICALQNTSVGTVKSRLFYAREKLKTTLKNSDYEN